MEFNSIADLLKFAQMGIQEAIQDENSNVKNVVVHELIESINENVYDAYDSPASNPYIRAKEHGGLIDTENFELEPILGGIAISSSRKGYDRSHSYVDVMEIIEGNKEYSVADKWGYGYESPRHAVEPARKKLRNGGTLKRALKLDLINAGFKVQ